MRTVKRIALIAAAALLCLAAAGCKKNYQPIMTCGETSLSVNVFTYVLSQTKTMSLYALGHTSEDGIDWDDEKWRSFADYIMDDTVTASLSVVYFAEKAREAGLTLTSEDAEASDGRLNDYVSGYGGRAQFDAAMAEYGVNYDILRDYYRMQRLAEKGKDAVIGKGGSDPVTEDEFREYYEDHYVTVRHFNLNNINKVGANGKEAPLTGEEKTAADARADEIEKALAAGEDMAAFADESDDGFLAQYPMGVTVPTDSDLYTLAYAAQQNEEMFNFFGLYYYLINNVKGFADAAVLGEIGKVTRLDTDKGVFFVQRLPLDEEMFPTYAALMADTGAAEPSKIKKIVSKLRGEGAFTIDEDLLATFTVRGAPLLDTSPGGAEEE